MEILTAIGGLIALAALLAWVYARSSASHARADERMKMMKSASEARDAMDEAFAQPVSVGGRLRKRMRDRASRKAPVVSDSE